ncbi:unnamed protein product [Clavelina lepadiformis]|uniref:Solute carrier family 35 member B4 n=1 Tax=Clavelina lepadiformis TaxID=159417 RepID=A0ABP0G5M2_CLALP
MATLGVVLGITGVISACCVNVIFLEHLINASSSSGNMIVFFQYLFVSMEGLIVYSKFGQTKRIVPLKNYLVMVVIYFSVSLTNIMALNCNIPMPLHMIFKSGSLVASMFLGSILLKRSYSRQKIAAVGFLSVGIFICTLATSLHSSSSNAVGMDSGSMLIMMVGITLLMFALLMSARLGIYQETLFKTYGQQSREALFYNHFLPLPLFVVVAPSIIQNIAVLNRSEVKPVPLLTEGYALISGDEAAFETIVLPELWQYMIVNLFTQYICIRSVFYLTTVCQSLSVTLIITLRKFVSLVISIIYFGNHFGSLHWVGTAFVFLGTFLYMDVKQMVSKITSGEVEETNHHEDTVRNGFKHQASKLKES